MSWYAVGRLWEPVYWPRHAPSVLDQHVKCGSYVLYRARFAPRIWIGGWTSLCSAFTLLAFFDEDFSVSDQWLALGVTLFSFIYFFLVLNYRVIITEEQISAPIALLSLSKPHALPLAVIQRLWSRRDTELGALQLCLESRDQTNKILFIRLDIVSWRLLFDLLPKLPPNVEVSLEKRLWALVRKERPDIAVARLNLECG